MDDFQRLALLRHAMECLPGEDGLEFAGTALADLDEEERLLFMYASSLAHRVAAELHQRLPRGASASFLDVGWVAAAVALPLLRLLRDSDDPLDALTDVELLDARWRLS